MSSTSINFSETIPDESLALIFSFLQVVDPIELPATSASTVHNRMRRPTMSGILSVFSRRSRDNKEPQSCDPAFGWIRVTFVCRRWRYIAIDEAILWTQLTNKLGCRWLEEFLARSRGALLYVHDRQFLSNGSFDPIHDLIASHHGRLSQLQLNPSTHSDTNIKTILSTPFEVLEVFTFVINGLSKPLSLASVNLFQGHAPCLRNLQLQHPKLPFSTIDWTTPSIDNLSVLCLALNAMDASFITSSFLQALRRMSQLQTLRIFELTHGPTPFTCDVACSHARHEIAQMPQLETLVLSSPVQSHAHLLHHLRLSHRARVVLGGAHRLLSPIISDQTYDALSHAIHSVWLRNEVASPFQVALMSFDETAHSGDFIVQLALSREDVPRPLSRALVTYEQIDDWQSSNALCIFMRDDRALRIMQGLPIQDVRSLVLEGGSFHLSYANLSLFTHPVG